MAKDEYAYIFLTSNEDFCVYYPSNVFAASARVMMTEPKCDNKEII